MENTGSRELIKSIMIMAGIPLAFSVACSLLARITVKKISPLNDDQHDHEESTRNVNHLKQHLLELRCKIEELQGLEREIEVRFSRFVELKDRERALMEVENTLRMEKERAEFLENEVLAMEQENKKFDEMVIEYVNALNDLESSRAENRGLRRREKKLLKRMKESLRLIMKQKLKIEAKEGEMLSNEVELKRKEIVIENFEREVGELRVEIDRLVNEKNEVSNRLEVAENAVTSKAEAERTLMENYNRVVNELENIKKDREKELRELIYLRWCHACLRHELARRNELEQETKQEEQKVLNDERGLDSGVDVTLEECKEHGPENEGAVVHHDHKPSFAPGQQHTKRAWLVRRFKKWVEGNEKHHEAKCFGNHDEAEERHSVERKSFSSV